MDRRRGGGSDRQYETTTTGTRTSRSPNGRKRRAVAADLFDDDGGDDDETYDRRNDSKSSRYRSSARRRSESPPLQKREQEHKRRKHHHDRRHHHHAKRSDKVAPAVAAELPFQARHLSYKHDYDAFTALFAYYLDIQKAMDFYALDAHEARGRWKSFVNKWNRGQLAEGWYEPEMYERITREDPARMGTMMARGRDYSTGNEEEDNDDGEERPRYREDYPEEAEAEEQAGPDNTSLSKRADAHEEEQDDVDDYGPPPPPGQQHSSSSSAGGGGGGGGNGGPRHGPGIPTRHDLALQREAAAEAAQSAFTAQRLVRKADRAQQKDRLDELLPPRADPGTRERQLEKKALVNDKMRSFRDPGDAMEEVGDKDLMGSGGADELAEYKRMQAMHQRKKTERELRREAEARAKAVEREARLREWKEREEEKLKGLKELARARFG